MVNIDICICTYKRPKLLYKALISIEKQMSVDCFNLRIIIVDNDELCSAKQVVNRFIEKTRFNLVYACEPVKNISLARNKCLSLVNSSFFCFIDDDEVASNNWLKSMYESIIKFEADVVVGPVVTLYPKSTPSYVVKSKFYDRKILESGHVLKSANNGNCMLKARIIVHGDYCYDESYGLTGGEDTKFFSDLYHSGAKIVYCKEGLVYETLSEERSQIKYMFSKAIVNGETYSRILRLKLGSYHVVAFTLLKFLYFLFLIISSVFVALFNTGFSLRLALKAVCCFGQIRGIFGTKSTLY